MTLLNPLLPDASVLRLPPHTATLATLQALQADLHPPATGDELVRTLAAAAATDSIWDAIRITAVEVAGREHVLQPRLQKMVLDRLSLADALAAVLAERLTSADMSRRSLHKLLLETIDDEPAMLRQIVRDLDALTTRDPACFNHLHGLLNMKGVQALQTYRVAHALWMQGRQELAAALSNKASLVFGVDIHPAARIGSGVMLDHGSGIVIGETAVVEDDVSILQNVTLGGTGKEHGDRHPKVRRGVMIGAGAKILGN